MCVCTNAPSHCLVMSRFTDSYGGRESECSQTEMSQALGSRTDFALSGCFLSIGISASLCMLAPFSPTAYRPISLWGNKCQQPQCSNCIKKLADFFQCFFISPRPESQPVGDSGFSPLNQSCHGKLAGQTELATTAHHPHLIF